MWTAVGRGRSAIEEINPRNPAGTLQVETPIFIDEGGILLGSSLESADFALTGGKWGSSAMGTSGGTVSYSFMGNDLSLSNEPNSAQFGTSVALSSLPGFSACFITEIQLAFAAWQAVSNIQFVQVNDSGTGFGASGATGDIRIGAHTFDGPSNILAHAYFPSTNGGSGTGDMHFDRAENWTCNTSGVDIGVVAMHEIGHALGLNHETTDVIAIMDPYYNTSLTGLQQDDINGVTTIYGAAANVSAPPSNDDFVNAKTVGTVPYTDTLDTSGAINQGDGPSVPGLCDNKQLLKGYKNVWYKYTPSSTRLVYMDALGSTPPAGTVDEYDTYMAVWTGPNINSLTLVTCDDDTVAGLQSQVGFTAQASVTYYIEVAQFAGSVNNPGGTPPTGGTLQFHATSFEDVGGNYWAWRYIEGLYNSGVTSGCTTTPRQYCPTYSVARDQMAVFLLKAKYGSSYVPPAVGASTGFNDVPTNFWAAAWIKQLAAEGITGGCTVNPNNYCPTTVVARDQMAVFLLKAKYGSSYVPPAVGASTGFNDVPTNFWAAAWIKQLAAEGITGGCGGGNYCPTTPVSRDQMAVFLDKTFGIAPIP
jgi:hypothetical protein